LAFDKTPNSDCCGIRWTPICQVASPTFVELAATVLPVDHHQVKPNSPLALLQKTVLALSKCASSDQRKHLTARIKAEYLQPLEPMPVQAAASAESAPSSSASSSRPLAIKEEASSQPPAKKGKVQ